MRIGCTEYREVWFVDFEFGASPGERSQPVCLVAREFGTGRLLRIWEDELLLRSKPPYATDSATLFVAYYASAELGCHLALDWPLPENVLDLYVEFRNLTNGLPTICGAGLIGALAHHGLDTMGAADKDAMRDLALRGGPWTARERADLLDYCQTDVDALCRLLPRMEQDLDLPRALLRGRFMKAAARIEHVGVPIDVDFLSDLRSNWSQIQLRLIERVDADYGVYEDGSFKRDRWAMWLAEHGIPWPRLPSGTLALDDDTFKEMARSHPEVSSIRELRVTMSQMRLNDLAVGSDGRNRCLLSAFRARTSRNQPSNSRFIFGPSVWLRSLIRPEQGNGLAYIDWSQQEVGIAAALSEDERLIEAYESGDPYLEFGKQAGVIPQGATKASHGPQRELFKACTLAVQYGMGAESLAGRIGQTIARGRELLAMHKRAYPVFWQWSDAAVDWAMLRGHLHTVFGWRVRVGPTVNPRSLRNFPMQANGAEMLRLACCFATERGIPVCAPVHDAVLIEAPLSELAEAVAETRGMMANASEVVLGGFRLRTEAELVRWPDRYMDERGSRTWATVQGILNEQ